MVGPCSKPSIPYSADERRRFRFSSQIRFSFTQKSTASQSCNAQESKNEKRFFFFGKKTIYTVKWCAFASLAGYVWWWWWWWCIGLQNIIYVHIWWKSKNDTQPEWSEKRKRKRKKKKKVIHNVHIHIARINAWHRRFMCACIIIIIIMLCMRILCLLKYTI